MEEQKPWWKKFFVDEPFENLRRLFWFTLFTIGVPGSFRYVFGILRWPPMPLTEYVAIGCVAASIYHLVSSWKGTSASFENRIKKLEYLFILSAPGKQPAQYKIVDIHLADRTIDIEPHTSTNDPYEMIIGSIGKSGTVISLLSKEDPIPHKYTINSINDAGAFLRVKLKDPLRTNVTYTQLWSDYVPPDPFNSNKKET